MLRFSAVFSARLGIALATGAVLAGCVVAPEDGGYYRGGHKTTIYTRYGYPPPPRAEHRPRAPGPDHVWEQGRWVWNGQRYHWQPGRWQHVRPVPPPHSHKPPPPPAHKPPPPAHKPGLPPHVRPPGQQLRPPPPPSAHKPPRPPEHARPHPPKGEPPKKGMHRFPVEPPPPPYRDRGPGGA